MKQTTFRKLIAKVAALQPSEEPVDEETAAALRERFRKDLDNDLNTALGITALYDVLKAKTNDATRLSLLGEFDGVLGLNLLEKAAELRKKNAAAPKAPGEFTVIPEDGEEDAAVAEQLLARQAAKKAKNFAEADRIRDELKAAGIELTDVPGGVKWKKV